MKLFLLIFLTTLNLGLNAQDVLFWNYPTGSEKFEAGEEIKLVWAGNFNKYLFSVDYSLDNAKTWQSVVDSISELEYNWTVPDTITDGLLFRVIQKPIKEFNAELVWSKSLGGSKEDFANTVIETKDGGYVTIGVAESYDGDIPNNSGRNNLWLVKFDTDGNLLWNKSYGGDNWDWGYDILELDDGGFLAVGWNNSIDWETGDNLGRSDGLVIRLDSEGNILWKRNYGGSANDNFVSVIQTGEGDFVFVGYSMSFDNDLMDNNGAEDAWIVKVDSDGDILWSENYGGSSADYGLKIVENDNSYYVVGYTYSKDMDIPDNNGGMDFLVLRISKDGDLIWANTFGGSEQDYGINIISNPNSGVTAIGFTQSFDGDRSEIETLDGIFDGWIINVDSSGILKSEKAYGSPKSVDVAHCIRPDLDGGFIVSGYMSDSYVLGLDYFGGNDAVIYKLDSEGKMKWIQSAGGPAHDVFYDVKITKKGEYIVTGKNGQTNSYADLFIAKFKEVRTKSTSSQMKKPSAIVKSILKPILSLNHKIIDMGDVFVNDSRDSNVIDFICNIGRGNIKLVAMNIDQGYLLDFSILNNLPIDLNENECMDLRLKFNPNQTGYFSANLIIKSNESDSTQEVLLKGNGISETSDFDYFVSTNDQNSTVTATIILEENTIITLEIYDILGRRVADLYSGEAMMGKNEYKVDFAEFQSGRYYIKLTTPTITKTEIFEVVR